MLFLCCFDAARFFFARALSFIRHTYLRAEDCSIWVRLGGRDFDRNSTDGGFAICQISVKFLSVFWMPLWPLLGSFGFPRRRVAALWVPFGALWGLFWRLWAALGDVLARFWVIINTIGPYLRMINLKYTLFGLKVPKLTQKLP